MVINIIKRIHATDLPVVPAAQNLADAYIILNVPMTDMADVPDSFSVVVLEEGHVYAFGSNGRARGIT